MRRLVKRPAGALTVEAALILPIVIFMLLPFLYLFRMQIAEQMLEETLDTALREIAEQSYVLERISVLPEGTDEEANEPPAEGLVDQLTEIIDQYSQWFDEETWQQAAEETAVNMAGRLFLKQRMQKLLLQEDLESWGIAGGWQGISMQNSRFFFTKDGHHDLIQGCLTFSWDVPFSFWKPEASTVKRVYHCFTGEGVGSETGSEENEGTGQTVYRIGQGHRYHRLSCYLIRKNAYVVSQEAAIASGLEACSRCHPEKAAQVYRTAAGEHYHSAFCSYLYPDLSAMTLEEAKAQGYTACGLCFSDQEYFS